VLIPTRLRSFYLSVRSPPPPRSALFPYTTLFRSDPGGVRGFSGRLPQNGGGLGGRAQPAGGAGPPPVCPAPARPPAARPAQTELNEQTRRSLFRARRVLFYRAVTAPAPAAGRRSAVPSAPPG